jgi:preprotein translocase subunit SecA
MTGTARAAADEFRQNYSLEVEVIPTSKPLLRHDFGCRIYLAKSDKLAAIVEEVKRCKQVGRPVLVGTRTIQQSIEISRFLTEHSVTHNLLNAVTCHKEAQIIQTAGSFEAVTVATDMAGRGTDIILEPNLDVRITAKYIQQVRQLLTQRDTPVMLRCYTSQEAAFLWSELSGSNYFALTRHNKGHYEEIGVSLRQPVAMLAPDNGQGHHMDYGLGLYVIGTEVNESPRIDLQLKGRAGRQGQFGCCRAFLSLEDEMLVYHGNSALGSPNNKKIDPAGRVYFDGRQVEKQRSRIQEHVDRENELGRGLALDYTRIADSQAGRYYRIRRDVMEAGSFFGLCQKFAQETGQRITDQYFPNYTFDDYGLQFARMVEEMDKDYSVECSELRGIGLDQLGEELSNLLKARLAHIQRQLGPSGFTELARILLLQTGDELWQEHIAGLQDLVQISRLFHHHGHKSAVADCATQSAQSWDRFQQLVTDRFLSRLLTCSLAEEERPSALPTVGVKLIEDVAMILT